MKSDVHFDPERGRLTARVSGLLEAGDILALGPQFLREHEPGQHLQMLLDYRGAQIGELTVGDVQAIAKQGETVWGAITSMRLAVVADNDATYGMARMFATLSDRDGIEAAVFRDLDEALRWLDGDDSLAADPQR